jgi:hypothetical protein
MQRHVDLGVTDRSTDHPAHLISYAISICRFWALIDRLHDAELDQSQPTRQFRLRVGVAKFAMLLSPIIDPPS